MNKKYNLLIAALLIPAASAQSSECIVQPSCADLGYTQSLAECAGKDMSSIRCPFDQSKVACTSKTLANAAEACKTAGYKYSASQCGKQGVNSENTATYRQLGIPCPYSTAYYYCQYPNQNAQAGWYLCSDGTASSTTSGCGSRSYVVGVVLKAPTYRSRGIVALTQNAYKGHGDIFQA